MNSRDFLAEIINHNKWIATDILIEIILINVLAYKIINQINAFHEVELYCQSVINSAVKNP